MKNPLLLFTLKCTVILYFAACTGIGDYTSKVSATPHVTKGTWKLNLYSASNKDKPDGLAGYTFTFDPHGKIRASKDGRVVTGNWSEDEISKRMTINLDTNDPSLLKLNDYWHIYSISNTGVSLQNTDNPSSGRLLITSL